jgi:hypothetical protein
LVENISDMIKRSMESILKANEYIDARLSDFKSWTKSFSEQRKSANPPAVVNPTFDVRTKLNATSKRPRTSEGSVSRQKELEKKIDRLQVELNAAKNEFYSLSAQDQTKREKVAF